MKVYISCDIEGLAGIATFDMEKDDHVAFRELYHQHVAWMLEGIRQSAVNDQIDEITISDSHSRGVNLLYQRLAVMDERVSLVNGFPRMDYMMSGLDESYDVVLFLGYHAGIGKQYGAMDHGYSSRVAYDLQINGHYVNETTINAAYAGELDIPVGLVVGESGLKTQLLEDGMLPEVRYVSTKESLGRYAIKTYPIKEVRSKIIAETKAALEVELKALPRFTFDMPATVDMECMTTAQADRIEMLSTVERIDGRHVRFTAKTMRDTMNDIVAIVGLGGTTF